MSAAKKSPWVPMIHGQVGDPAGEVEVFIIRMNNAHGMRSYGWADHDYKRILLRGYDGKWTREVRDHWFNEALALAEFQNKREGLVMPSEYPKGMGDGPKRKKKPKGKYASMTDDEIKNIIEELLDNRRIAIVQDAEDEVDVLSVYSNDGRVIIDVEV